ncbi:MAG: acyl-CoA dehydrogenase [Acidimicrobiales bacterium]|jgi:alkylation response protein AidB-like acyl-CoA dehydrogenase|nr:acyl-CoA dehydrogenase [Acidimicrobiales bacterium]
MLIDPAMDFDWTEEQAALRSSVIAFARAELAHDVVAGDAAGAFPRAAWDACGRFGIQGLPIPEVFGGQGADALTTIGALEALGYGCPDNGLLFAINAHLWSCAMPLLTFGSDAQKRRYLPGLSDGSLIGVQAMTEADAGSDSSAITTTATRQGERYLLRGAKTFITNAPIADVFLVFVVTGGKGIARTSAFLVDRDTPGLTIGPPLAKMGLRTAPLGEIALAECDVPASARLGEEGDGGAIFLSSMEWERAGILAGAIGTMERQVEQCIDYARTRRQFGQPIGDFQAVSHTIVDMKLRLETARLLLYRTAWRKSQGRPARLDASLTKLHLSECFVQSSIDALQLHGGHGYLTDNEIERDVRDAIAGRIYSGTSEMQRNIAARILGL